MSEGVHNEINGFRKTELEILTREAYGQTRVPWRMTRRADQISRAQGNRFGVSQNVRLIPGDAWVLAPMKGDFSRAITGDYAGAALRLADVNAGDGVTEEFSFGKRAEPGLVYAPDVETQGLPGFKKRLLPGMDWGSARLAVDEDAFPKPPLDSEDVQMDRVIAGRETYSPNAPFGLIWFAPEGPRDNHLTFYFGGPADVLTLGLAEIGELGGQMALNLRGDGTGVLFEKQQDPAHPWAERFRCQVGPPGRSPHAVYSAQIQPYGHSRIAIFSAAADAALTHTGLFHRPAGAFTRPSKLANVYRDVPTTSGHLHARYMTGAGVIRADRRQDDRTTLHILRLFYPETGVLTDEPFKIDYPVYGGLTLGLDVSAEVLPGCSLQAVVHDASTGNALAQGVDGRWFLTAGQQYYFVRFTFNSPGREQTPVLWGYRASLASLYEFHFPQTKTLEPDQQIGIQVIGASQDPSTGSARCGLQDFAGEAEILRQRGRLRSRLITRYDAEDLTKYAVLFEGETQAEGVDSFLHFLSDGSRYYSHNIPMGPWWNRVGEGLNMSLEVFFEDPDAPRDPKTGFLPAWKITDVIRYLFNAAGVPDDELDIPDLEIRLWAGFGGGYEDFLLMPQTKFAEAILRYVRDFLGGFIVRDFNAGERGKWRLLFQPAPPYRPLAEFVLGPPGELESPGLVHHYGTYGPNKTFALRESYREKIRPPEANYILVVGHGGALSNGGGSIGLHASLWNPKSFNMNPTAPTATDQEHPDYHGRMIPLLYVDFTLQTQQACNYVCRRLYDRVAHAERLRRFRAPALLIEDEEDEQQAHPRPLRLGDAAWIPLNDTGSVKGIGINRTPTYEIPEGDAGGHWADYDLTIAEDAEAVNVGVG